MRRKVRLSPYLVILLGYLILIVAGCGFLLLPFATKQGISFIDALFLSASSVCITGLSPVTLSETFTDFGQAVILLLVQVGGLGFVTIAMTVVASLGLKLGFFARFLVNETLGSTRLDYRRFLLRAVLITAIAEGIGFLVNLIALSGTYSGGRLVWISLFHSVSAFNNAGLDLFGGSMAPFEGNVLLLLNTCFLTIAGGLGFLVINEIFCMRRWRKFSVHTKIVLIMTPALLLTGALLLWVGELGNTNMDLLNAFFMSTQARTCGFSTQNLDDWRNSTLCIVNVLMFIGAGPVSTGGGIKCTTCFIFFAAVLSLVRGKPTIVCHRRIPRRTIIHALVVIVVAAIYAFVTMTVVCACNNDLEMSYIFTEAISALANVGFSAGITASLSVGSKLAITLAMFLGRAGFLTVFLAFKKRWEGGTHEAVRYVDAEVIVG